MLFGLVVPQADANNLQYVVLFCSAIKCQNTVTKSLVLG